MNHIRTVTASCFIAMFCVLFLANLAALAQDANLLSRDIKNELRSAKSLMFKGKAEEALGLMGGIQGKIDELKSSDPKHFSIKGIERDYDKLKKDLSRRIGKETGPPNGEKSTVSEKTSAGSDKLNSAAGRYVRKMD